MTLEQRVARIIEIVTGMSVELRRLRTERDALAKRVEELEAAVPSDWTPSGND